MHRTLTEPRLSSNTTQAYPTPLCPPPTFTTDLPFTDPTATLLDTMEPFSFASSDTLDYPVSIRMCVHHHHHHHVPPPTKPVAMRPK